MLDYKNHTFSNTAGVHAVVFLENQNLFFVLVLGDDVVVFLQTLHEDIGNFVHLVLVVDGFQKFFAVSLHHPQNDQLAAVGQSLLRIVIDGGERKITGAGVFNRIQNLEGVLVSLFLIVSEYFF